MKHRILFIFIAGLMGSCANQVMPGGGPKDETPPRVIRTYPNDSSTLFKSNTIQFEFSERIETVNPERNIIISPPLPFTASAKKNTLHVQISDTSKIKGTYTVSLINSIKDITEGNILHSYIYAFTTESALDTGSISGTISGTDKKIWLAMLYPLNNNSTLPDPVKDKPGYITAVSEDGSYSFSHIAPGNYFLFACEKFIGGMNWTGSGPISFIRQVSTGSSAVQSASFKPYPSRNIPSTVSVFQNQSVCGIPMKASDTAFIKTEYRQLWMKDTLWLISDQQTFKDSISLYFYNEYINLYFNENNKYYINLNKFITKRNSASRVYSVVYTYSPTMSFSADTPFLLTSPGSHSISFKDSQNHLILSGMYYDSVYLIRLKTDRGTYKNIQLTESFKPLGRILFQSEPTNRRCMIKISGDGFEQIYSYNGKLGNLELPTGKYRYSLYQDINGDGKTEPGNWKQHLTPDPLIKQAEFTVKKDWEIQLDPLK